MLIQFKDFLELIVFIISMASVAGSVSQKIKDMHAKLDKIETKQDKHNDFITRLSIVEVKLAAVEKFVNDHISDDKLSRN